jgi:hypothetical protein
MRRPVILGMFPNEPLCPITGPSDGVDTRIPVVAACGRGDTVVDSTLTAACWRREVRGLILGGSCAGAATDRPDNGVGVNASDFPATKTLEADGTRKRGKAVCARLPVSSKLSDLVTRTNAS